MANTLAKGDYVPLKKNKVEKRQKRRQERRAWKKENGL